MSNWPPCSGSDAPMPAGLFRPSGRMRCWIPAAVGSWSATATPSRSDPASAMKRSRLISRRCCGGSTPPKRPRRAEKLDGISSGKACGMPGEFWATLGGMDGAALRVIFDLAACLAAGIAGLWLSRIRGLTFPSQSFELPYLAVLVFSAGLGAYLFGTLNLWLSGAPGIARSVEGALAGGIVGIELYKWRNGISLRTGARFALPLAIGIAVGRIGCFLAGLDDFTYGTPTALPWGHDFGDGIMRHPVQLYESAAMGAFAMFYLIAVIRPIHVVIEN